MAGTVYISEAEAARDFAGLMRRVRAGDEVVVEEDGRAVAVVRAADTVSAGNSGEAAGGPKGKKLGEIIESIGGRLAMPDEDFAADVASAREGWGAPVDTIRGKTAEEVIRAFARWEAEHGKLSVDDAFADDVMEAHRIYNQPLDDSKWG